MHQEVTTVALNVHFPITCTFFSNLNFEDAKLDDASPLSSLWTKTNLFVNAIAAGCTYWIEAMESFIGKGCPLSAQHTASTTTNLFVLFCTF